MDRAVLRGGRAALGTLGLQPSLLTSNAFAHFFLFQERTIFFPNIYLDVLDLSYGT